jgi:hypothetical protein
MAFLIAFLIAMYGCAFSHAQTLPQLPRLSLSRLPVVAPKSLDPIGQFRDLTQQVQQFISQFAAADLQAAIDDANSQVPPDLQGAACWSDLKTLLPPQIPEGAAIAYLIQKSRDFKLQLAKAGADCSFSPKLVQVMLQISVALDTLGP